jgi:hypothetical protein
MLIDAIHRALQLREEMPHLIQPSQADYDRVCLLTEVETLRTENTALRERVKELTQRDPCWYDASPADAFMLLAKAQEENKALKADYNAVEKRESDAWSKYHHSEERVKRMEAALSGICSRQFRLEVLGCKDPLTEAIAQAALKEGE